MIEIEHLNKTFTARSGVHHALSDINLRIEDGDVFGIIGQSGAGKSTLVRCINMLEQPTSGIVRIDGADITGYRGRQLLELRSRIGMIFQNFSLFQQRTVLNNVTFPLELSREGRGGKNATRESREARAKELLQMVGLADYADRYPSELSGGQQQRVAIARALANEPKIMLCDEATSALDTRTTVSILNLLKDINGNLGVTMVLITHSLAVARMVCNRIAVIDEGHIVEEGSTDQVFSNPQSQVTRELLHFDSLTQVQADEESRAKGEAALGSASTHAGATAEVAPSATATDEERAGN